MKKRMNIISMLVLLTFGILIGQNMYKGVKPFMAGMEQGYEYGTGESDKIKEYIHFDVKPVEYSTYPDSIYNEKTNSWMPYRSGSVEMLASPSDKMKHFSLFTIPFSLGMIVLGIIMIIKFIKLINTINKSIIFDKINIKRLRFIGAVIILFFLINGIMEYCYVQVLRGYFEFEYYKISGTNVVHTLSLILGLVSFLIAEIFAVGLKLKEEQELTI